MAVASNSFTTLSRLKARDNDLADDLNDVYEAAIDAVSEAMRLEIGTDLSYSAAHVEEVKSRGGYSIRVRRLVTSLTSAVKLNLTGTVAETITVADVYVSPAEPGLLIYQSGWPNTGIAQRLGVRRILPTQFLPLLRITYAGGYVFPPQRTDTLEISIPKDLEMACIYAVNDYVKSFNREDLLRANGEFQFVTRRGVLPQMTRNLCKKYRFEEDIMS